MDDRFRIPGTNFRFGLDPILGLIPGVGDGVTAISTIYLIRQAKSLGLPGHLKWKMIGNLLLDMIVGSIPLVGDLFDAGFRANRRNVNLIKRHLAARSD